MTVFRILSEYGYHTSYNRNAAFYALRDVPQFDPAGFWAYRGICFSRHGSLSDTMVALVENAVAGQTVRELEERLQTRAANLLCRLVRDRRLTQRSLQGRLVVYLASDPRQAEEQFQHRQQLLKQLPAPQQSLPEGCSTTEVIEILLRPGALPQGKPRSARATTDGAGSAHHPRPGQPSDGALRTQSLFHNSYTGRFRRLSNRKR